MTIKQAGGRAVKSASVFVKRENGFFAWAVQQVRVRYGLSPSLSEEVVLMPHGSSVNGDELWKQFKSEQRAQGVKRIHPSDIVERYHVLARTLDPAREVHYSQRLAGACNRVMLHLCEVSQNEAKEICNDVMKMYSLVGLDKLYEAIKFRTERNLFVDHDMFAAASRLAFTGKNMAQIEAFAKTNIVDVDNMSTETLYRLRERYNLPIFMVLKESKGDETRLRLLFLWKLLSIRDEQLRGDPLSVAELRSILEALGKCEVRSVVLFRTLQDQGNSAEKTWDLLVPVLRRCEIAGNFGLAFGICSSLFQDGRAACLNPALPPREKVIMSHQARSSYLSYLRSVIHNPGRFGAAPKGAPSQIEELERMVLADPRLRYGTTNQDTMDFLMPFFLHAKAACLPEDASKFEAALTLFRKRKVRLTELGLKSVIKAHSFSPQFLELLPWMEQNSLLKSFRIKFVLLSCYVGFLRRFPETDKSKIPVEKLERMYAELCQWFSASGSASGRERPTDDFLNQQVLVETMSSLYFFVDGEKKADTLLASESDRQVSNAVYKNRMAACMKTEEYDQVALIFADMESNGVEPDGMSVELLLKSMLSPGFKKNRAHYRKQQLVFLEKKLPEVVHKLFEVSQKYPSLLATDKTLQTLLYVSKLTNNMVERDRILQYAEKYKVRVVTNNPAYAERLQELSEKRKADS